MIYIPKPKLGSQLNTKHPLSKGLVGCFVLNEGTGNKIINSNIGNGHSTNVGAAWTPEGLYFDGADRVSVPEVLIGNSAAFTISATFNGAAGGIIYGEGYSGDSWWALFLGIESDPPYSARFLIKENNVWKATTVGTTTVNDGWHSVSLVQLNKSYRTIYIDGIPEATNTDTVGDISILDTSNIGVLERDTFGSYFTGGINQIYIHNRGIAGPETKIYSRDPYAIFRQPEQLLIYASFVPAAYILTAASGQYGLTGQTVDLDKNSKIITESGLFTASGQNIELKKGSKLLIDSGDYNISGNDSELLKNSMILIDSGSFGITGQDVDFIRGLKIDIDSGIYAIAGQGVTLTYTPIGGYTIIAGSGAYAITGFALDLFHGYRLDTESGSFEISGQNVSLLKDSKLLAESGIYNITGQSTSLLKGFFLELESGIYNLTGNPVEFVVGYMTIAGSGVYGLTGNPVDLFHGHLITADSGEYNISGNETDLLKSSRIYTGSGFFGITGEDINFLRSLRIDIDSGIYDITGQNITLIYSGTIYIDGCLKMVFSSNQPTIMFADISNQPTITFTDRC